MLRTEPAEASASRLEFTAQRRAGDGLPLRVHLRATQGRPALARLRLHKLVPHQKTVLAQLRKRKRSRVNQQMMEQKNT